MTTRKEPEQVEFCPGFDLHAFFEAPMGYGGLFFTLRQPRAPQEGSERAILFLCNQSQPLQCPGVFRAGGDEVDAGGLDGAVAQHVRQLRHVPADLVERPGEQVAQVVGEDLGGLHPRPGAQGLHLRPDLFPGQAPSASGEKDLTGGDFLSPGVFEQLPAQLARQQDGADLALEGDLRPAQPGISGRQGRQPRQLF